MTLIGLVNELTCLGNSTRYIIDDLLPENVDVCKKSVQLIFVLFLISNTRIDVDPIMMEKRIMGLLLKNLDYTGVSKLLTNERTPECPAPAEAI